MTRKKPVAQPAPVVEAAVEALVDAIANALTEDESVEDVAVEPEPEVDVEPEPAIQVAPRSRVEDPKAWFAGVKGLLANR